MPLPTSGPLSMSAINAEVIGVDSFSLRTLSAAAGFSTPDAMSEFYGYSAVPPGPSNTRYVNVPIGNSAFLLSGNAPTWAGAWTANSSFSVCFWLYPYQSVTNPGYAFHIRNSNATDFFSNNIAVRWSNFLGMSFFMSGPDTNVHTHTISGDVRLNQWTHYVITYNRNTRQVIAYRNGAFISQSTVGTLNMLVSTRNLAVLGLAGQSFNNNGTAGRIDELAFYNRILTSTDVQDIYNSRYAYDHTLKTNLSNWFRFESNSNQHFGELGTDFLIGYNWNNPTNIPTHSMPFPP